MAARRGRGRGGRGRGRKSAETRAEGGPYPLRFQLKHPTRVRTQVAANQSRVLRGPIRCLTSPSSTSTSTSTPLNITNQIPDVQPINDEEFHCNPAAEEEITNSLSTGSPTSAAILKDKNDLDTFLASRYIDPQPSSDQVLHVDVECATNFAPAYSRCFSSHASLNLTEIAQKQQQDMEEDPEEEVESTLDRGFEFVHEHRVKIGYAPLVRAMFERYGDITDGSNIKSPGVLSLMLEHICVMYTNLKETQFFHVTLRELENMLAEVRDLEGQKMNVGWLRERIESVIKTKIEFGQYLAIKEEKSKRETSIKRLEKEIPLLQQQLCAVQEQLDVEKVKSDEANELALDIKGRIVDHTKRSLAHGLL